MNSNPAETNTAQDLRCTNNSTRCSLHKVLYSEWHVYVSSGCLAIFQPTNPCKNNPNQVTDVPLCNNTCKTHTMYKGKPACTFLWLKYWTWLIKSFKN